MVNFPVSRQDAKKIAQEELSQREMTYPISHIEHYFEITCPKPNGYIIGSGNIKECWIAYLEMPSFALRSSTIVAISCVTGEVIYIGDAGDEG